MGENIKERKCMCFIRMESLVIGVTYRHLLTNSTVARNRKDSLHQRHVLSERLGSTS